MTGTMKTTAAGSAHPGQANPKKSQRPQSKGDKLIALLARPQGASLETLMKSSGWQAHSVRGFLSGTLGKKLGRTVLSQKTDKGRMYHVPKDCGE